MKPAVRRSPYGRENFLKNEFFCSLVSILEQLLINKQRHLISKTTSSVKKKFKLKRDTCVLFQGTFFCLIRHSQTKLFTCIEDWNNTTLSPAYIDIKFNISQTRVLVDSRSLSTLSKKSLPFSTGNSCSKTSWDPKDNKKTQCFKKMSVLDAL